MSSYTYSIINDTLNAKVVPDKLQDEINASDSIDNTLSSVGTVSSDIIIKFATALDAAEQTALNAIVAAHDGEPVEENGKAQLVKLKEQDKETGGVMFTPRYQPQGWLQQLFEIEFETSTKDSIHEKDPANNDIGWSSLKFYKDVSGVETEMTNPTQTDLDNDCIRTDFLWMPVVDYQILSGQVAQISTPASDFYVWGVGIDLDAVYGGPQIVFAEGGINMAFVGTHQAVGLKGKGAPFLYYSKVKTGVDADGNPVYQNLPPGVGSNRMRFICRHPVGFKHRLQPIFEIFRSP